jgi:dTDP-4-dehydrorhamnose reductase
MRVLVTGGAGQLAAEFAGVWPDGEVWAPGRAELDVCDERSVDAAFERHDSCTAPPGPTSTAPRRTATARSA